MHEGLVRARRAAQRGPARARVRARCARARSRARADRRRDRRDRAPAARDARRARPRRARVLRVGADVARSAVSRQQAREGLRAHAAHRVELAALHGERGQRLQAVARRGRPARLVSGFRARGSVLRDRFEHGRLPSDPVPADDGAREGGREARRRRPAPHRDGAEGGSVPEDPAGHRSRAAQWAAASAARERPDRRGFHRRAHRGLGRDARLSRRLHAAAGRRAHRARRSRHPARRAVDRRRARVDELLDDGAQPEHARHVEHERDLQPASRHGQDLPAGQRAVLADRAAERDGRPRDGLHGAGAARPALGARRRRPPLRRGNLGLARRHDPAGRGRRHRGPVREDGGGRREGVLDHLHESGRDRREPQERDRRAAGGRRGDRAGRVSRHRDQPLRGHPAAGRAVGGSRGRDDQLGAQPDADAAGARAARRRVAGLADRRGGRARDGVRRCVRLWFGRRGVRRDPALRESEHGL
ncbi:Uncharacterised protein [Burkholderia pseudomallei]|nr:Uncharacterised protein [Burkholderia pseudomallei]CAJ5890840.1 Uncharacterised protein [Burkholderia pseudomallei]CAJ7055837.1 Uncharacterised protein [Burkholderia pseudomallei]CAJ7589377.1 Uncharacterised protein [Burkholderia pseudomallei]CAJ9921924.1 Uncharacterised protein [Burkholderia pseudomallei]